MGWLRLLWVMLFWGVMFFAMIVGILYLNASSPGTFRRQLPLAVVLTVGWLVCLGMGLMIRRHNQALKTRSNPHQAATTPVIPRVNVTSAWRRRPGRRLELNLTELSLNGTRLGGDIHRLSFLGPAEDDGLAAKGHLEYFSGGLQLEEEEGRLTGIMIDVASAPEDGMELVIFGGRGGSKRLDRSSTEADITAALGAPFLRDERQGQVELIFERRNGEQWVEILLDLDEAGRLGFCSVSSYPSLADPNRRQRLGITVDWPPERETGLG